MRDEQLEYLEQAERAYRLGADHISRQRDTIAELQRNSHDTLSAEALLAVFLETQRLRKAELEQVRSELRRARWSRLTASETK